MLGGKLGEEASIASVATSTRLADCGGKAARPCKWGLVNEAGEEQLKELRLCKSGEEQAEWKPHCSLKLPERRLQ